MNRAVCQQKTNLFLLLGGGSTGEKRNRGTHVIQKEPVLLFLRDNHHYALFFVMYATITMWHPAGCMYMLYSSVTSLYAMLPDCYYSLTCQEISRADAHPRLPHASFFPIPLQHGSCTFPYLHSDHTLCGNFQNSVFPPKHCMQLYTMHISTQAPFLKAAFHLAINYKLYCKARSLYKASQIQYFWANIKTNARKN